MYPEFVVEPQCGWTNRKQLSRAHSKQRIYLKKLIVKLSGSDGGSDTPQVKMAGKQWNKLNFNNVTSVTIRNQKVAILNKTKKGHQRSSEDDRVECAKNYTEHVQKAVSGDKTAKIHGKRLDVGQLAKDGYSFQLLVRLRASSHSQNVSGWAFLQRPCVLPSRLPHARVHGTVYLVHTTQRSAWMCTQSGCAGRVQ